MKTSQKRGRMGVALLVCITLLIGGSFIPLAWKVRLGAHGPFHLRFHFVAFAICGLVAYTSARTFAARAWRSASLVLLAFALEAMQKRLFGDRFEWSDVAADSTGAIAALLLIQVLASFGNATSRQ